MHFKAACPANRKYPNARRGHWAPRRRHTDKDVEKDKEKRNKRVEEKREVEEEKHIEGSGAGGREAREREGGAEA